MKVVFSLLLALSWLLMTGCDREARTSDETERDHPAMKKALEFEKAGDLESARMTYQGLLDQNPRIARAHLALALILDGDAGSYPESLYHYQRYLALRPDTEKRGMIESRMRSAQLAYVAMVFTNEAAVLKRMGEVERENAALKVRAANLEAQSAHLQASLALARKKLATSSEEASRILDARGLPVPSVQPAGKVVRVERGDTLRKISERVYGTQSRWREIYEANRTILKKVEDVRVGQVLVIPE